MDRVELPSGAIDAMLKEHALIRVEIAERLKTAFTHVAYAGAVVAFAIPAADKVSTSIPKLIPFVAAAMGLVGLLWVAALNMRWVLHSGVYLMWIEHRVNQHFGCQVFAWEHYAEQVRRNSLVFIPKSPKAAEALSEIDSTWPAGHLGRGE